MEKGGFYETINDGNFSDRLFCFAFICSCARAELSTPQPQPPCGPPRVRFHVFAGEAISSPQSNRQTLSSWHFCQFRGQALPSPQSVGAAIEALNGGAFTCDPGTNASHPHLLIKGGAGGGRPIFHPRICINQRPARQPWATPKRMPGRSRGAATLPLAVCLRPGE